MQIDEFFTGGGIIALVLTLVQVTPIKINPWSWLAKKFGRAINGEVLEQLSSTEGKLKNMQDEIAGLQEKMVKMECEQAERDVIIRRVRIIRFGDELLHRKQCSKDYFDQILGDIVYYDQYCEAHPEFENGKTKFIVEYIKEVYAEKLEKNDFL